MQIQLTGFLDKDTASFCKELWNLCLSAQSSPQGVPKELLEAKKLELIQEKVCYIYIELPCLFFTSDRSKLTSSTRSTPTRLRRSCESNERIKSAAIGNLPRFENANAENAASEVVGEIIGVEAVVVAIGRTTIAAEVSVEVEPGPHLPHRGGTLTKETEMAIDTSRKAAAEIDMIPGVAVRPRALPRPTRETLTLLVRDPDRVVTLPTVLEGGTVGLAAHLVTDHAIETLASEIGQVVVAETTDHEGTGAEETHLLPRATAPPMPADLPPHQRKGEDTRIPQVDRDRHAEPADGQPGIAPHPIQDPPAAVQGSAQSAN